MKEKVLHELDLLPEEFIVLVKVNADGFEEANMRLLSILVNDERLSGSYITTNRTYDDLKALLKHYNVDEKSLFFIDCVSKEIEDPESAPNAVFLPAPNALTEIEEIVDEILKKRQHGFVFLDSINSMMIYNEEKTVLKFLHILSEKLRRFDVKGIFITVNEESSSGTMDEVAQFCDRVVNL